MKAGQRKPLLKGRTNEKGYTVVIAIIIMMVLLIIGTAVLTAAANSLNTVNRRVDGRQTYYIAKSSMNVIDKSMHNGELGNQVRNQAYKSISQQINDGNTSAELGNQKMLVNSVVLSGEQLEECAIENMEITYNSTIAAEFNGTFITEAHLVMDNIKVSFTARCGKETYKIKAVYNYSGIVNPTIAGSENWKEETWVTKSISQ